MTDRDQQLDEMERQIKEILYQLQLSYEQARKPYLRQLARIQDLRPSRHLIELKTAMDLGLLPTTKP